MKKGIQRDKFFFFYLRTAGQSRCEVGVNVGSSVPHSYRNGNCAPHSTSEEAYWQLKTQVAWSDLSSLQ